MSKISKKDRDLLLVDAFALYLIVDVGADIVIAIDPKELAMAMELAIENLAFVAIAIWHYFLLDWSVQIVVAIICHLSI